MVLVLFILLLSVIIVIHEFGHLIAAKIFNVYCHEFSMGMGPLLFKKKFKETTYSLRMIPIGGFVAMAGDTDNALETSVDVKVPFERTLPGISTYKRIIIMLAGIMMNIVLALLISSFVFLSVGRYAYANGTVLSDVWENYPAYEAGLRAGDEIVKLEYPDLNTSIKPDSFDDISLFMYGNEDKEIVVTVRRNTSELTFTVIPEYNIDEDRYMLGISSQGYNIVDVNLGNFIFVGADYLYSVLKTILFSLSQLFRGIGLNNLSGPVGIYQATSEAVNMGIESYLLMIAVISLNVGVFNALPLPILDGGRVVIALIEKIIGKPLEEKYINIMMSASMVLLLGLMLFATMQDILRLF